MPLDNSRLLNLRLHKLLPPGTDISARETDLLKYDSDTQFLRFLTQAEFNALVPEPQGRNVLLAWDTTRTDTSYILPENFMNWNYIRAWVQETGSVRTEEEDIVIPTAALIEDIVLGRRYQETQARYTHSTRTLQIYENRESTSEPSTQRIIFLALE